MTSSIAISWREKKIVSERIARDRDTVPYGWADVTGRLSSLLSTTSDVITVVILVMEWEQG